MMPAKASCALIAGVLSASLVGCGRAGGAVGGGERKAPFASQTSASPTESPSPTSTVDSSRLSFAVIGDFGSGTAAQWAIAQRMCRWRVRHPFDLVVTTGDNVYPDGAREGFSVAFFDPYACLFDAGVTFRATLGNHDVLSYNGRPELEEPAFGMERRNYVVRTNHVRFVLADSNNVRWRWLRRATRARRGDRWTIVVFHHPVYSPGMHGSTPGFRPRLPRLFRRRGVDLVLNGHDHIYSVTKPLSKIRYVVSGGGGASLYDCGEAWFTAVCRAEHHFLYVTTTRDRIVARAVPAQGRPFHRFVTYGRR